MDKLSKGPAHGLTRRKFLARSATGAVVVASGLLSGASIARAASGTDELYAAAKKEGSLVWWCGCLDRPAMDAVYKAFMATYPGIDVQALWQTGEVVYTRIQQDLKAGVRNVDVFGTSNAGHWPLLKSQNSLIPFESSGSGSLSKLFKSPDPDHTFRAAGVEVVIINYRSDKVSKPPTKWTDFLDPEWDNKITMGSPQFSGDMVNWTIAMLDKYGDKYLVELAKRNPKIGRSILGSGTDILAGERLIGSGVDANTFYLKAGGNPIDVQFPDDDAVLAVGYTGILKTAPHPNAAKLFMEFTDSKEYSKAMTSAFRFPIRADVKSFGGLNLETMKTYQSSIERLSKGTAEARAKWKEAMGI
jgi:iron(III) transport system substrate-binding protein